MPYHAEWEALYDQEIYAAASLFLLTIYFMCTLLRTMQMQFNFPI